MVLYRLKLIDSEKLNDFLIFSLSYDYAKKS